MRLDEKNIFLLDGFGAVLSAVMTGIVLPFFSEWMGLSKNNLRLLGGVAAVFAIYSLTCFWFVRQTKSPTLLGIISANSLYVLLALSIALFSNELTTLGQFYFIIEAILILGIVFVEIKVYRRSFPK